MIYDWDLWPYRIAADAPPDELSLAMRVMSNRLATFGREMGLALYPAMQNLARAMERMAEG